MKKKFLCLMALMAVSLLALAEMSIFVYQKDGEKVEYLAANVDSIGFVDVNAHEWVDLGLPSGTKWATMNVGADSPEDYGDYFAWGETTPKSFYIGTNYNYSSSPTTLPLEDDAAYTNWGTSWRMPTKAELTELVNEDYTVCTWITQNGVNGWKVTSKINGNTIFLPAAGFCRYSLSSAGSRGNYWSSSLAADYSYYAYYLCFGSAGVYNSSYGRYDGQSVRPVLRE